MSLIMNFKSFFLIILIFLAFISSAYAVSLNGIGVCTSISGTPNTLCDQSITCNTCYYSSTTNSYYLCRNVTNATNPAVSPSGAPSGYKWEKVLPNFINGTSCVGFSNEGSLSEKDKSYCENHIAEVCELYLYLVHPSCHLCWV